MKKCHSYTFQQPASCEISGKNEITKKGCSRSGVCVGVYNTKVIRCSRGVGELYHSLLKINILVGTI